jgi:ABC-type bacteriocin/lantibiotic exporter with double-glycine peptidase domain
MNGESTLPEHNVNRKLKNPKPVKEYGYNKEKKRWNVYTTRSRRKNTKLNENEFNELKDEVGEALATAEELEAVLEANNITFREVRTPADLISSTRVLLLALDDTDGRPLVIHRQATRTLVFDPQHGGGTQPLTRNLSLKPFAFELYAGWPKQLRSATQLLGFSFHSNLTPLLAVLFSSLVVALFNLSIPALTGFLASTVLPSGQLQLITETSMVVALVAISTLAAQFFSSLAMVRMESLINLRVEAALWSHLLRLPLAFFSQLGTADLITRVSSIRLMRQLVSNGLLSTGLAVLFSLSNLVLMVMYQSQLALVAGLFSLVSAIAMGLMVWRNARLEEPLQEGQAQVSDLGRLWKTQPIFAKMSL